MPNDWIYWWFRQRIITLSSHHDHQHTLPCFIGSRKIYIPPESLHPMEYCSNTFHDDAMHLSRPMCVWCYFKWIEMLLLKCNNCQRATVSKINCTRKVIIWKKNFLKCLGGARIFESCQIDELTVADMSAFFDLRYGRSEYWMHMKVLCKMSSAGGCFVVVVDRTCALVCVCLLLYFTSCLHINIKMTRSDIVVKQFRMPSAFFPPTQMSFPGCECIAKCGMYSASCIERWQLIESLILQLRSQSLAMTIPPCLYVVGHLVF